MSAAKTCPAPGVKTISFEMVGTHTVKRKPQLCLLSFRVTHEADSAEEATDKVTMMAKELAGRLSELAPPKSDTVKELAADEDDEDIVAAVEWPVKFPKFPVTTWSMQSIHTYNYVEHVTIQHDDGRQTTSADGKRRHCATINLGATFHNFDALAVFTTLITANKLVQVDGMSWRVSEKTNDSLQTRVRQGALRDAIRRAKDYSEVVAPGIEPRVTSLKEGGSSDHYEQRMYAAAPMAMAYGRMGGSSSSDRLNFEPEPIQVSSSVAVSLILEYE